MAEEQKGNKILKNILVEFDLGEVVFCRTDPYNSPAFITAWIVTPNEILYRADYTSMTKDFRGFQLSREPNVSGNFPKPNNNMGGTVDEQLN